MREDRKIQKYRQRSRQVEKEEDCEEGSERYQKDSEARDTIDEYFLIEADIA